MNLCLARLLVLLVLILAVPALAQAPMGTVHLHNGGRIHGELMEVLPGEQVRLRLADGSIRSIPWSEVASVDDPSAAPAPAEQTPAPQPAPAAPMAPAPYVQEAPAALPAPTLDSKQVTLALFGS